jgi:hypothetical protein
MNRYTSYKMNACERNKEKIELGKEIVDANFL